MKSGTLLNEMCEALKLPIFRPNELSFIAECVTVMQPLANALDILQGEQKCFLGVLLPTIVCLKNKLIQCKSSIKFTASLVDSILAGISNRFDSLLTKKEMILNCCCCPSPIQTAMAS